MRYIWSNLNHSRMFLFWREKLNVKIRLLEGIPHTHIEGNIYLHNLTQPARLTPKEVQEITTKGLCFNYDTKYSKGHKCSEK